MRRNAAVLLGVLAALLVAAQLIVPGIVEHRAEDRLQRQGGTAHVSLGAVPALRLLFDEGDSANVKGSGLTLNPESRGRALQRLDGFDKVSVTLDHLSAGPLDVSSFRLKRGDGQRDYSMQMSATTSPRDVARFLGSQAGGPFGGLLGSLAGGSVPGGGTRVPLDVNAVLASRQGDVEVRSARASVAGIPAGPLAELVVAAVARRF